MNRKEWVSIGRKKELIRPIGFYEWRNKAVKYFELKKGEVIHHLRETEEQRAFNDAHYERWGFNFDGKMKFAIKMTKEEHDKHHQISSETKNKLSIANKKRSKEIYKKIGKSLKKFYEENPGYASNIIQKWWDNRTMTEQEKINRSNAAKENIKKIGVNKKFIKAAKGKKWFTNNIEEIMAFKCPEGWKPGRLKGRIPWNKGHNSNKHWYTNGVETKQLELCPDGWWPGRTFNK